MMHFRAWASFNVSVTKQYQKALFCIIVRFSSLPIQLHNNKRGRDVYTTVGQQRLGLRHLQTAIMSVVPTVIFLRTLKILRLNTDCTLFFLFTALTVQHSSWGSSLDAVTRLRVKPSKEQWFDTRQSEGFSSFVKS